ncbi:MAG TPA: bifunctional nicotinamidase/pyrazinamidase [Stellaceae bacterium]|nr:bifunctional nicotinamidase/pyrazinamidase [Stellaceae bacterium]
MRPGAEDVLLVVDLQNDFMPGGALPVPRGDEVVPLVNEIAARFPHVVLTQDWHPRGHRSFASAHAGARPFETAELAYGRQVLWPDHCVQGTAGAAFHPALDIPHAELVIRKGYNRSVDSYSAFCEADGRPTGLAGYLRERKLGRVLVCGLALDFCVAFTACDARAAGFPTILIADACRAIDTAGSLAAATERMAAAGVERLAATAIGDG